jgi:hypothetical protein
LTFALPKKNKPCQNKRDRIVQMVDGKVYG